MTSVHTPKHRSPSSVLARLRSADELVRDAEVERALAVLEWVDAHPAEGLLSPSAETIVPAHGGERALGLGGASPSSASPTSR